MRLWSIHPRYLDAKGLVALWREGLLARAVLRGETRGYRRHPQLERFRECIDPLGTLDGYLDEVLRESLERGYSFDAGKISPPTARPRPMDVTDGQVALEWRHLCAKLDARSPDVRERWATVTVPAVHPSFVVVAGPVADWERADGTG